MENLADVASSTVQRRSREVLLARSLYFYNAFEVSILIRETVDVRLCEHRKEAE
jgi:hypothetical protein